MKGTGRVHHISLPTKAILILLCIMFFISSSFFFISFFSNGLISPEETWGRALYILPGIAIIKYLNSPAKYTILIISASLGSIDILSNVSDINEITGIIQTIIIIIDLIMISSGIHCYLGDRHSASRMFIISALMVLLNATFIIFYLYMSTLSESLVDICEQCVDIACFALFMLFLSQPGVREESVGRRLKRGMLAVEAMMSSSDGTFIYADDVDSLMGIDKRRWVRDDTRTPFSAHFTTRILDPPREFIVTSKKLKRGGIMICIEQDLRTKSYGSGFLMSGYSFEERGNGDRYIRIYGEDGMFIRLLIKERTKKKNLPRIFNRSYDSEDGNLLLDTEEELIGQ